MQGEKLKMNNIRDGYTTHYKKLFGIFEKQTDLNATNKSFSFVKN